MNRCGALMLGLSIVVAVSPAGAKTLANEGVCNGLMGRTPGLYGLCLAFCEAQDCEPDFSSADPFAGCKASDPKLLALYQSLAQPGDPEMPCIVADSGCPCFTREQVAALPKPYRQCLIDYVFPGQELVTNVLSEQSTAAQAKLSRLSNDCIYADATTDPPVFVFLVTTRAQATECRQIIVDTIEANTDQCQTLCDPDCN